ncbi:hypothetical protein MMC26_001744 [Xylographa opegraphella]|nr:hypothetical protein [Xylographa opegraphella]
MADVRTLLRNERASRRINHPQASYSSGGTLSCRVCQIPLKSESLWDLHVKSAPHLKRSKQIPEGVTYGAMASRKRKADDDENGEDLRKRSKAKNGLPGGFFDQGVQVDESEETQDGQAEAPLGESARTTNTEETIPSIPVEPKVPDPELPPDFFDDPNSAGVPVSAADATTPAVDESEWAAFEADVARLTTPPPQPSALTAEATISAAPLTAAEIAARSREEASIQAKERREAEIEGEKEDASRRLEEEFDEMEELESRVRRLREKREEIRRRREEGIGVADSTGGKTSGLGDEMVNVVVEEDEDEDDWDEWEMR